VIVAGLPPRALARLTGQADAAGEHHGDPAQRLRPGWVDDPSRSGGQWAQAIEALREQGFLIRTGEAETPVQIPRLAADVAALRARHGGRAATIMHRRRDAAVVVHGTTRVATVLAGLLAAAGVGRVSVAGEGDVRLHQAAPGGINVADEGRRFVQAAMQAVLRAAPDCDTRALSYDGDADLVAVVGHGPVDPQLREALHRRDLAHLCLDVYAARAVVGPLVVPGWFSCLHCADRHRLDRDPAWSLLAVQLESPRRHPEPADVALGTFAAGLAAMQCLAYLDGELPATIEATLELCPPDWRVRRRSWPAHPDCDCGAGR
jgi:hypothetical protein